MILKKHSRKFQENNTDSFITQKKLFNLLENQADLREELKEQFINEDDELKIIKVGNSKDLFNSLIELESQCNKIDIEKKIKDIQIKKMLENEKAIFEIFHIENEFILKENKSDLLEVETAYSAKSDILDIYSLSKFANYCRDMGYDDLIEFIRKYLEKNNVNNDEKSLRLLFSKENKKFYLRAVTSTNKYKNYGINFSVLTTLISLNKYVEDTNNEIFIDSYYVDDSTIYVSFSFRNETPISNNIKLSFNLTLENDETKRNSVAFNGVFKLMYEKEKMLSDIYIKPKGLRKNDNSYPVDLLTYRHTGGVNKVFEKLSELPNLINFYIEQVKEDSLRVSQIEYPDDIRKHIANKIKASKKEEFKKYKKEVFNKLMKISVDNTFSLFEVFRSVEDLFEHDDVISRDYWRTKLYEALIERN